MAQRIIVQDGKIVYSTSDPTQTVDLDIRGQATITKQLVIGDDPMAAGSISTPTGSGVDLIISTHTDGFTDGNIKLEPVAGGQIVFDNVFWPDGTSPPVAGTFLGASALNTLQFYPFVIGFNGSDTLTQSQLNIAYPLAQPGQSVVGPTVVYQCVAFSTWRTMGGIPSTGTVTSVNVSGGTTGLTTSGGPVTTSGVITLAGILDVPNGGTGASALTGYIRGNGVSPFTAASTIPGSDISGNISGNAANITGTVAIANGGTGQISANPAFNALAPSQATNSGKFLSTDGTNTQWTTISTGTVTSVDTIANNGITISGNPITTAGTLTFGLGNITPTSISTSGNITLTGTGQRIIGHFSDTVLANRPAFQNSILNVGTSVGIVPNGTGGFAQVETFNGADPDNSSIALMGIVPTEVRIISIKSGTGTLLPIVIRNGVSAFQGIKVDTASPPNVVIGFTSTNLTTATDGFLYVPTCAGVPTGVPTAQTGKSPVQVDSTNDNFYFYSNGSWRTSSGGALTNWTESKSTSAPNATVPVDSFSAIDAATDVDAAIVPKGAGALLAAIPDNTIVGGNKRGANAVDLQTVRTDPLNVASGVNSGVLSGTDNIASNTTSVVAGGDSNTADGTSSTVGGGLANSADGNYSTVPGGFANQATGQSSISLGGSGNLASAMQSVTLGGTANVASGVHSIASGFGADTNGVFSRVSHSSFTFVTAGDAQTSKFILLGSTTGATSVVLSADRSGATTANQVVLPNNANFGFTGKIVARDTTNSFTSYWTFTGAIKRGANAAATALVASVTPTLVAQDAGLSASTVSVTADTTLGALKITGTGIAVDTVNWVAVIDSLETFG